MPQAGGGHVDSGQTILKGKEVSRTGLADMVCSMYRLAVRPVKTDETILTVSFAIHVQYIVFYPWLLLTIHCLRQTYPY